MIKSILVANRGEIACRIFRTCRKLGIRSIAVFSDADKDALHVKMADSAYYIGSSEVSASYLNIDKIVEACKATGADAIHPGYGFLSENEQFARRLQQEGIIFIGPNPDAIEWMGSKSKAKSIAEQNQVPVVPGYKGSDQKLERFSAEASKIGYPVLLKAAAGGGGKGMRIVNHPEELETAFNSAKREALNAFGSDELLIEKYFPSSRHIEIQIMGDKHGNVLYLLERECTIQRRYQKIFEESPSPVLSAEQRRAMGEAAVRLAKALKYDNAGTVEFIYADGEFYFLEVNTRLQVEHPVTEAITGLDLVEMQIACAEGKPLTLKQEEIYAKGYALECRLYAEDPENNFLPTTGTILRWQTPHAEGLRFDSGITSGSQISIFYDPMISKIIAHGQTRAEALRRMQYALRNTVCLGTVTNHAFLLSIVERDDFALGEYDTHFIAKKIGSWKYQPSKQQIHYATLAALLFRWNQMESERNLLKDIPPGWRNIFFSPAKAEVKVGDSIYKIEYNHCEGNFLINIQEDKYLCKLIEADDNRMSILINHQLENFIIVGKDDKHFIQHYTFPQLIVEILPRYPQKTKAQEKGSYVSPMPATVVKVLIKPGDVVSNGQSLIVLSSMKMENTIAASDDGIVEEIYVAEGQHIEAGKLLLKISEKTNDN
ncbi:MAG: acetyl-CoA carboxylase biotin carboxylase subunit [Chitinophagales bacterium]|nr:acetyl-CoA carboxylase biotin carboxylase subunit [Chitinophagales bacterium]MDW8273446.1 acetyl-CoA carboxylase biotin carboxylase subunit [Chitinophagales bacterium]